MRLQYKKETKQQKHKKWHNTITILIKAFERPRCLSRLVKSIRKRYKDILILIADDSRKPKLIKGKNIKHFALPFDVGLSAGRNFILEKVKTKYFLLLEDDFVFIKRTNIKKMFDILENYPKIDILGGSIKDFRRKSRGIDIRQGTLEIKNNILRYFRGRTRGKIGEINLYDMIGNFFMARTNRISRIKWDPKLKMGEHKDFFIRCKKNNIVVGKTFNVRIGHIKNEKHPQIYREYRRKGHRYFQKFLKQYNIRMVIDVPWWRGRNRKYSL